MNYDVAVVKRRRIISPSESYFANTGGTAPASYTGPGDIVSGALAWFGLRAYNAAYATGSNPGIDVVDTATGLITTTINIKSDGSLDTATILGLGYGVSVKKIYDQSGNGNHATQATLANMPALTLNVVGARPGMTFNGAVPSTLDLPSISVINQPYSFSVMAKRTSVTTYSAIISDNLGLYFGNAADVILLYAGNLPTVAAPDNVFYSIQGVANGAASIINVNGTPTTVDAGTTSLLGTGIAQLGANGAGGTPLTGIIGEAGIWPTGFTAPNNTALAANIQTYWGV